LSMVATIFVLIAVNILGYFVLFTVLTRRIRREASPETRIREEVNKLMVELNQTTDRNIALIEDRIASLTELLSKADKKIGLLRRESEKHDMGARVYGRIREAKTPDPAVEAPREPAVNQKALESETDLRERVVALHRAGFTASLIASRVGAPRGEVELILSLENRKESR
jgi:hypothetical protein